MQENEANALIARVRRSVATHASRALQRVVADLAPTYAIIALAIREPPFPELPETVAAVRKSYPLQCSADGMLYQLALCRAARDLDLEVHQYRRGENVTRAAEELGIAPEDVESFVSRAGRPSGPPWTQDHRRAYAAGIVTLAARTRGRIRVPSA
jgi:hypothetical protein